MRSFLGFTPDGEITKANDTNISYKLTPVVPVGEVLEAIVCPPCPECPPVPPPCVPWLGRIEVTTRTTDFAGCYMFGSHISVTDTSYLDYGNMGEVSSGVWKKLTDGAPVAFPKPMPTSSPPLYTNRQIVITLTVRQKFCTPFAAYIDGPVPAGFSYVNLRSENSNNLFTPLMALGNYSFVGLWHRHWSDPDPVTFYIDIWENGVLATAPVFTIQKGA